MTELSFLGELSHPSKVFFQEIQFIYIHIYICVKQFKKKNVCSCAFKSLMYEQIFILNKIHFKNKQ